METKIGVEKMSVCPICLMPTIVDAMCSNCRTAFEKGRKQSVIGVYKEILGKSDFFRNKMPDGRSHCELRAFIRTRIKELEK